MAQKTTYDLQVRLGAKTSQSFKSTISQCQEALNGLNTAGNIAFGTLAAGGAASAAAMVSALTDATATYKSFETEIKTVESISGATASEFTALKEAAMEAGQATVFTATEAASALEYTSLAGWSVEESIQGLPGIIKMTAATGKDLKTTSDLVTDSMSAAGVSVDELEGYMDKLIQANNKSNTTAEQLMEAMIGSSGAARTLGASMDDTITSLGVFANNGLKGTEAGTALNAIFVRLAGNTQAIKELGDLNVDIWDKNGEFVGFEETLERINTAMSKFTSEQKAASLKKIAGTNYYSEMAYLLDSVNAADGENSAFEILKGQIEGSQGALDKMYNTTTDTLDVAEKLLESAEEDMQIQFIDVFADDAKDFVLWLADSLPIATEALTEFAEAHQDDFADALEKVEDGIEVIWEKGLDVGEWLIENQNTIISGTKAFAAGIAAIKAATVGLNIAKALTNPTTAAGIAIWSGVTALGALKGHLQDVKEAAIDANLSEHFGDISLSLEELDTLARQIVGESSLNGVLSMMESAEQTASAIEKVTDVWAELQKNNWKINIGFNMSDDDYADYGKTVEEYISAVEAYAEDKGYEVHLAATLLFGEDSEQDAASSTFFASLQKKLTDYGADLHDYLYNETNGALLDGIIDIDEDAIVQEYLSKISSITAAISEAENAAKLEALELQYSGKDLTPESMSQLQEDIADYTAEVQEGAQQAYESLMTEYHARLSLDSTYTQEDFNEDSTEAWEAYYQTQADAAMNGIDYMLNTIHEAYPELQGELEQYQEELNGIMEKYMNGDVIDRDMWESNPYLIYQNMQDEAYGVMKNNPIDEDRDALKEYLNQMTPTMEALIDVWKAYEDAGIEIPEEMQQFQQQWQLLKDLVGNDKGQASIDLWSTAADNNSFTDFLAEYGMQLDEESMYITQKRQELQQDIKVNNLENNLGNNKNTYDKAQVYGTTGWSALSDKGIAAYKTNTQKDIEDLRTWTEEAIDGSLSEEFSTSAYVNIDLNPTLSASAGINRVFNLPEIKQNAEGGIYNKPILTTFAEEGAEAAVPLDGSQRAKSIWRRAGEILGVYPSADGSSSLLFAGTSSNPGSNIQLEYKPQIVIQGSATQEDIQKALSLSLDDLREMLTQIQQENTRTAFG